jgi:hypothetical protein
MTSRDEQRRKRRADSFRRDEADEADNWLAGLRGGGRGEPDPFTAPPPFDELERSAERSGSFERPRGYDGPPRGYGGPGGPDGGSDAFPGPGGPPSRGRGAEPPARSRRARGDDSPSGVFSSSALPPAPPPARPSLDARVAPDATQFGGRRRVRDDDSPSGTFTRPVLPPGAAPAEPRGRRRARDPEPRGAQSYSQGPELTPIIKPLTDVPPVVSQEPPPLVPIFPAVRPDASPTSGAAPGGRRARRAAEDDPPGARSGDVNGYSGDVNGGRRPATDDTASRRARGGFPGGFPGDRSPLGPAVTGRDDTASRRARGGFPGDDRAPFDRAVTGRDDTASRRQRPDRPDRPDLTGEPARGAYGRAEETTMFPRGERGEPGPARRDGLDTTGSRRARNGFEGGFEAAAPATEIGRRDGSGVRRRDEALRRPPPVTPPPAPMASPMSSPPSAPRSAPRSAPLSAPRSAPLSAPRSAPPSGPVSAPLSSPLDEPPHQRRALDDAMPYDASAARRRAEGRRGTGEYSGDYTSGGTRRALREPPGGRPPGPPGRPDRGDRLDREERRGRSGSGVHPRAVLDPVRPEHRPHRWVALLSVIAVVVVLGACGMGTWFIFKDEKNGPDSAKSSATTAPKKRDISSRAVDPKPLTEAEVFPRNNIVAVPDEPPYVIMATKAANDCKVAATEQLATLLANAGCTEVVRATMKSPNEEYLITAGIFNLVSEKVAAQTFDGIKPIVDGQKGRFAGMSVGAGTGTDALVRAPTQLGWNYKGHFITYCVIARVDGNTFAQGDPYPNQITYDIVETYLDNGIIDNRAVVQPEATPAASLPASAPAN